VVVCTDGGDVVLVTGWDDVVCTGGGDEDWLVGEEDEDGEVGGVIRVGDGWRVTGWTAATGCFGGPGRFATVEASAVPAATAKIVAQARIATLAAPRCRGP
jgi:hypothetical protein